MTDNLHSDMNNKIDNYIETIFAILSFSHLLRWDNSLKIFLPDSFLYIGRKMDTSGENRINPNDTVTPDLIVQLNKKNGIVGEVKIGFPVNQDFWKSDFDQIQKYDDKMKGWITSDEIIDTTDIVLLTHITKKTHCVDYIKEKILKKEIKFDRKFAVIAFSKDVRGSDVFLYLEKAYGDISDLEMNEVLRIGKNMPLSRFISTYRVKFYDSEPPLPYLMSIIWQDILPQLASEEDLMEKKGRIIHLDVNIEKITELLQEQFTYNINHDERQQQIPKTAWVRTALDLFVQLGYGEKKGKLNDDYIINWQNLNNSPLNIFIKEYIAGKRLSKRKELPERTRKMRLDDYGF